nr:hypothetical protein [Tanacetum cinerariifolium]
MQQSSPQSFPWLDPGLVVPSFNPSDNPIASLNKVMAFLTTSFASYYPPTNNQLRTSSNPRNQVTIQDGRFTVQAVQGRQTHGYTNSGGMSNAKNQGVNRNGVAVAFQTNDLDAFDSNCDDTPLANAILKDNLFSYDSDVLSEFKAKNVLIEKLKEHIANLKGKNVVERTATVANSNVVTSKVYKLDFQPLSPRVKNNRDVHVDYLKVTQEHNKTIWVIVKQARALKPLDNALDYA